MPPPPRQWIESGSPRSPLWIIAEAPGYEEVREGRPLCGPSGRELDKLLSEAGWPTSLISSAFRTNICHERPPSYVNRQGQTIRDNIDQWFPGKLSAKRLGLPLDRGRYPAPPIQQGLARLAAHLAIHRPQLIILLGGSSLWGLCGKEGITKWRGSVLPGPDGIKTICTLHPAIIVDPSKGQYTYRPIILQDLRRALREYQLGPSIRVPPWNFLTEPTLPQVRDWLTPLAEAQAPLVCDTEGWGVVDCIGFARSDTEALCVPLARGTGESYWSLDEEVEVFALLHRTLTRCPLTFHNALWDLQVIANQWRFMPLLADDTMVAQHCAFPGLLGGRIDPVTGRTDKRGSSLSLSFCSSMYCDIYSYWKDDGRLRDLVTDDASFWRYNCEDCVRTWEVRSNLVDRILPSASLVPQYRFLMSLFGPVLKAMFRGVRLDPSRVESLRRSMALDRLRQQDWLDTVLGYRLNVHRTDRGGQMQALFYEDLGVTHIRDRKTRQLTLNDDALELIAKREPLLVPLVRSIQNIRSLDTNDANMIQPALRAGDRLRTCLNIAGPETFRFSSNETAFGEGTNLQNIQRPPSD